MTDPTPIDMAAMRARFERFVGDLDSRESDLHVALHRVMDAHEAQAKQLADLQEQFETVLTERDADIECSVDFATEQLQAQFAEAQVEIDALERIAEERRFRAKEAERERDDLRARLSAAEKDRDTLKECLRVHYELSKHDTELHEEMQRLARMMKELGL